MAYRRSHKKSRAGCLECKRRHIKCDEGRPVCRLCTMAERETFCSYGPLPSSAAKAPSPAKGNVPALMTSSEETTPSSTSSDVNMGGLEPSRNNLLPIQRQPSPSSIPSTTGNISTTSNHAPYQTPFPTPVPVPSLPGEALNMEHIELVVHMMRTKGMFNLGVNIGNYYKQMAIGFEYGLKDPYLTHQFLAYAARHLAYLHPDRYMHYTHQADTHQTRAIQLFNLAITPPSSSSSSPRSSYESQHNPDPINQSNCVAVVLFSSVLGQTLIAETFDPKLHPFFTHPNGSLEEFLKSYTQCLNTFRGVYHIGASAWPLLLNTPLAGYLLYSREFNHQVPRGHQCDLLVELLNMTYKLGKMSDIEHQVCLQLARYLQVGLDAVLGGDDNPSTTAASDTFSSEKDVTHASSIHIPIPIDPRLTPNPSPPSVSPDIPIPAPQPPNCLSNLSPTSNTNSKPIHHAPDGTSKPTPAMSIAIAEPPQEVSMSLSLSDLESDPTDPEMTRLNKSLNKYQMLSAFSMLCPAEFSSMLEQKRPEALVILGYYALLLHYGRHMWQVGEAGRVILGMVDGYLGRAWRGWLKGPVRIVLGDGYGC